jgi:hypothetical protein
MKSSRPAHRILGTAVLVLCLAGSLSPAQAYEYNDNRNSAPGPSADAMFLDWIVLRPLGLAATVGGGALYVLSLPFSALGGNEPAARQRLMNDPASYTFRRCLGCAWGERPLSMGQTYDYPQTQPGSPAPQRYAPAPGYQQRSAYPPPRGYYK